MFHSLERRLVRAVSTSTNAKHISVPDEAILPVLNELFERFNFTVMESTPFDIEVAVDPEMLGKMSSRKW